jgi:hypothetical protein
LPLRQDSTAREQSLEAWIKSPFIFIRPCSMVGGCGGSSLAAGVATLTMRITAVATPLARRDHT